MLHDAKRAFPLLLALGTISGCLPNGNTPGSGDSKYYDRADLVADRAGEAHFTDDNLVNPWGIAYGPDTYFWVANNGTSTSTLYGSDGAVENDAIGGPMAIDGAPTGLVYNGTDAFEISWVGHGPGGEPDPSITGPSRFLFATSDGKIFGWNADVDPGHAVLAFDHSGDESAYLGLAIATSGIPRLYASDFRHRRIDVFGGDFAPIDLGADAFRDPSVPADYGPFGIHEVDGRIYVAYARQNAEGDEEVAGPGFGRVSVFKPDGTFVSTVADGQKLNAPWGVTLAPTSFGKYAGALLVGNFGDGRITAFDASDYHVLGQLEAAANQPVEIEGLWGLTFGNGGEAGRSDRLYFTAGTDDETHGLFGALSAAKAATPAGGGGGGANY